jgi:Flp pilus assembly protein TadG
MRGIIGKRSPRGGTGARSGARAGTFLGRLAQDTRGNTLAIMAAALVPFAGMVGGAIDMSRLYITKTRLQHACDAGALAGRKRMGAGTWSANSGAANTAARDYFFANYTSTGMYGGSAPTIAFAENAGKVTGAASATVPMTLMRILGQTEKTLSVACDAEMRLPNTDIMFVLDTTGSMQDKAINTDSQTKIVALKSAVKCFYEIVARLDTTENCATGAPSGGVGNQVQVRFGFVPYATNVNVGRLLPTGWFADSWNYQTRQPLYTTTSTTSYTQGTAARTNTTTSDGNWYANGYTVAYNGNTYTYVGSYSGSCGTGPGKTPADIAPSYGNEGAPYGESTTQSGNNRVVTYKTNATGTERDYDNTIYNGACHYGYRERVVTRASTWSRTDTGTVTTTTVFSKWRYWKLPVDISGLKNGTAWNTSFQLPIGNTASGAASVAMKTINWHGCIEERETIKAATYTSTTGGAAKDLDIDTVPSAGSAGSLWGPALHDLIYARGSYAGDLSANDIGGFNRNELNDNNNYATIDGNNQDSYYCPSEARKLQQWASASGFESYVDGLTTGGNTYHDIGLLWGARFVSPTGLFASDNALTPQGGEIDRNLIFMTDGETCTGSTNYGPYGLPWYDRRQTDDGTAPTYGCETETATGGTLSEQVNARYSAFCSAV